MARQSPEQKETVERVMHEFKHGELERRDGKPVRNPRQAIAIALHEAGASNEESPKKNRANLRRTKAKERRSETARDAKEGKARSSRRSGAQERTRADLYAEARRRNVPGRSRMNKDQLEHALRA
jgi:hypothetical protein